MKLSPRERFLAKVCPEPGSGCWLWRGMVRADGYGIVTFGGKQQRAHRLAWVLFRGSIGPGLAVCHKCDVPACVNPDHLFLGTDADNARDRVEKGRSLLGEKHRGAKLTAEQVSRIKTMLDEDRMYMSEIAREFGVAVATIHAIKAGKNWRNVAAAPLAAVETKTDSADQTAQEFVSSEDDL